MVWPSLISVLSLLALVNTNTANGGDCRKFSNVKEKRTQKDYEISVNDYEADDS